MRFLIENELKRMQNFNRKRKKGQSPFVTYNAGDVEKGMATFNKNMGATETSASQSSGEGLGESLDNSKYELVNSEREYKEQLLSNGVGVCYWVVSDSSDLLDEWSDIEDAIKCCDRHPNTYVERCIDDGNDEDYDWEVVYDPHNITEM